MTTAPPESRSLDWITRLISLDTTSRNSNLELIDLVAEEMRRHGLAPMIVPNEDGTKANLLATIAAQAAAPMAASSCRGTPTSCRSTGRTGRASRSCRRSGTAASTAAGRPT